MPVENPLSLSVFVATLPACHSIRECRPGLRARLSAVIVRESGQSRACAY